MIRGVKIIAGFGLQIETSSALGAPGDPRQEWCDFLIF
jgi:hypothetical protein